MHVHDVAGRPAVVNYWIETMQTNSFDALLSPIQSSQQPAIDAGVGFDIIHNATGSFVVGTAGYTGAVPQIAGSGEPCL